MGPYFKEVEQIKQQTKQLKTNVDRLGTLYTSRLEAANTKGMQETSAEIDTLVDATNKLAILVQNKLKQLSQDNDSLKDQAEQRIKKNIHSAILQKFVDTMQVYQGMQQKHRDNYRMTAANLIKTANPDATEEEIEDAITSGSAEQIFAQQTLARREAAKQAHNYVISKHKEILKIEQSLIQLHQLFVDMSVLVQEQSEIVANIEHNVQSAQEHTGEALKELRTANKYHKKARKKMIIIIIIIVVVFIVVCAILFPLLFGR